jgi:hypothetical protein
MLAWKITETEGMEGMRNILTLALAPLLACALLLACQTPVMAQTPRPIDNPEKFAADMVETIANGDLHDAATTIAEATGQPNLLSTAENGFQKKFDFHKKVVDNEIGGALREIIHYSFIDKLGFIYFRFNFKIQ